MMVLGRRGGQINTISKSQGQKGEAEQRLSGVVKRS